MENPARVLRWNTDKRYLGELAADGLAVVPTTFLLAGDPDSMRRAADPFATVGTEGDIVVKPTVSAGSKDTARHSPDDRATAAEHTRRLLAAGRDVMVQPYLDAVDDLGETGMVFLRGEFSHGFRKGPLLLDGPADVDGLFALEQIGPHASRPTPRSDLVGRWSLRRCDTPASTTCSTHGSTCSPGPMGRRSCSRPS